SYEVSFNAASLSSGVYFYKLESGDFIDTKKMFLLK
ncbi:MAG TPA: T9SS type A sorting domain-containing protein, partial [Ignavibacteria bacterium]|nr:T9SS type A sorting domain-containing protein [Ignavibacteria bacterium]HRB01565.1 T9SS type A sorting domain-containing protein [Ignavibacteria bacterium]